MFSSSSINFWRSANFSCNSLNRRAFSIAASTLVGQHLGAGEGVPIKEQPRLLEIGKAEVVRNFAPQGGRKVALFGLGNLMIGAQYVHDHVMHFYHLHALDWVDVVSALKADPKKTSELAQSISSWPKSSPACVDSRLRSPRRSRMSGPSGNTSTD